MKVLIYVREDKSVTVGHLNHDLIALMGGDGFGWNQEKIDYEINKWVNPPPPEEGLPLRIAKAYVEGIALSRARTNRQTVKSGS